MKKRILSLLLAVVMVLSLIPATVLTANAAGKTMVGIELKGSGYMKRGSYYLPEFDSTHLVADDGSKQGSYAYSTLCYDEACKPADSLSEEPELGETYYFYVEFSCRSDVVYDVTNANSSIEIDGFSKGRVIDVKNDGAFYEVYCSIMYGELTGGVKAVASSVQYDSELGGYAPQFTTLKAVSAEGKELEPIKIQDGQYYYSYYGAESGCLYKTNRGTSFSDKLTTEPQVGETYYSYILLDSIDGNLNIEEDLVDIQIPGYDVEYIDCYERDMGFKSLVVYSVTKKPIWVGGVEMFDGDYLAAGATKTQTTKPSGGYGYAYYKDGKLTLNNYSYTGYGFDHESNKSAIIYTSNDIQIELVGTNTLRQKSYTNTACIRGEANVSLTGAGILNLERAAWGIISAYDVSIEGGNLNVDACELGVYSSNQEVIINGGSLKIDATKCAVNGYRGIEINGGSVILRNTQDSVYHVLHSRNGTVTINPSLVVVASTTADGELGEYVAANLASYKKIVIYTPGVYVGGVGMSDGDYLAVGATATQTTKPSGGYAYYENGVLTLNNYSYEGKGYQYDSIGSYATVYANQDLTVKLVGTNSLVQEDKYSDAIRIESKGDGGCIIFDGTGSLCATTTAGYAGIYVDGTLTVNGGTIVSTGRFGGMISLNQDIIINDGNVTVSSSEAYGLRAVKGVVEINGGTVTATGTKWAVNCDSTNFTVAEGMKIQASTTVDGELGEYVAANHDSYKKIVITEKPVDPVKPNPFTDVKEGDFFYDPVMWAVENGITTGATATTFNPGGTCLRAQVVTFLHRAAGNPEPTSTKNPFTDVKSTDFFYKPVLWAVDKGITNGTSATKFGSMDNCNRAAVVTFLWRAAGSPEPRTTSNPFVDVKTGDFFYKPVLWAVENGITNGVDATHFGPTTACNRAQVVTFLFRVYN